MKNLLWTLAAVILFTISAEAQINLGIKAGLSSSNFTTESINTEDGNFSINLENTKVGFHIGGFVTLGGERFFIQPEVLFNSSNVEYALEDVGNSDGQQEIISESYKDLDIPIMVGARIANFLRIQLGPVGHIHLNDNSSFADFFPNFQSEFDNMTFGWQGGLGVEIGKNLLVDLKYEGNFSDFGTHINIGDQQLNFSEKPSRVVASIGFMF